MQRLVILLSITLALMLVVANGAFAARDGTCQIQAQVSIGLLNPAQTAAQIPAITLSSDQASMVIIALANTMTDQGAFVMVTPRGVMPLAAGDFSVLSKALVLDNALARRISSNSGVNHPRVLPTLLANSLAPAASIVSC